MMRASPALLLLILTLPTVALAQSNKYPPEPVDKDVEQETRSELWESALNPELRPYTELVRAAEGLLQKQTNEDTKLAIEKLGDAIAKLPNEPQAYLVRGRVYLSKRNWPKCADDLGAAEDHSKDPDLTSRTRLRIDLGVCQARANRLAPPGTSAERLLALVRFSSRSGFVSGIYGWGLAGVGFRSEPIPERCALVARSSAMPPPR